MTDEPTGMTKGAEKRMYAARVRKSGPRPKSLRYRHVVRMCEDALAEDMPKIFSRLRRIALQSEDARESRQAAQYLVDRVFGKPQKQTVAPAEDNRMPEEMRTAGTVASLLGSLLTQLPEGEIRRLQDVYVDSLKRHGLVEDDGEDVPDGADGEDIPGKAD